MSARAVACEVVRRTFEEDAYADRAFRPRPTGRSSTSATAGSPCGSRSGRCSACDARPALEALAGRPPDELQPTLRAALRVGAYQLLFAGASRPTRPSTRPSSSASGSAASHSGPRQRRAPPGRRGGGPLGGGLPTRCATRTGLDRPGVEGDARRGRRQAVMVTRAAAGAGCAAERPRAAPVDLGVPVHGDPGLPKASSSTGRSTWRPAPSSRAGGIWPQSRAAMLPARARAGARYARARPVLRAGGEGRPLAALMGDRGELVCVERHPGRARAQHATLDRFGGTCAGSSSSTSSGSRRAGSTASCSTRPAPASGCWPAGPTRAGAPTCRRPPGWRTGSGGCSTTPRAARPGWPARLLGVHDPARRGRGRRPRRPPDASPPRPHGRVLLAALDG